MSIAPLALILHATSLHAEPLVIRVRPSSVEGRPTRTATEDAGLQASRLYASLAAVNSAGKGADCPKTTATKLPGAAAGDVTPEPRYADVMMANGRTAKVSVVPKSMLPKIYETMKTRLFDKKTGDNDPSINWANECLCQERAHFLGDKLARKLNIETGKLLVSVRYGPMAEPIVATLPNKRSATWKRHAANFVMVEEEAGKPPVMYALDVSLFPDAPVPVETWRKTLKNVGAGGWSDVVTGKANLAVTNRFAYGPGDQASYIDDYPSVTSSDSRSLRHVSQRLYANNDRGSCLGRM